MVLAVKNSPGNVGDLRNAGLSSGRRHGNPLQYSCLENPIETGTWRTTVRRIAQTDTTKAT